MRSKLFLQLIVLFCCAALLIGCNSVKPKPDNLAEYAVAVENNQLKPQGLEFLMTVEDVCKTKGLLESELRDIGRNTSQLICTIAIEGLSDEVYEVFTFYEGKLINVHYMAAINEADYEKLIALVAAQAKAILPEAMRVGDHFWIDSQGNQMSIGGSSTDDDHNHEVITLGVSMAKSLIQSFFS